MRSCAAWLATSLVVMVSCPRPASAHRDDYLNETLVYLTLEDGELEAEYWFDLGWRSDADFNERAGAVIPQLWLAFAADVTLKLGYAFGVDQEVDDFARIALEAEF